MQLDSKKHILFKNYDYQNTPAYSVLDIQGNVVDKQAASAFNDQELLKIYGWMLKIRLADQKCINMQRQGKMGTYLSVKGQEACQVGATFLLNKDDWLVPAFRESGMMQIMGVELSKLLLYWMGSEKGSQVPDNVNVLPISICVGSHIPHAAGIGWAERLKMGRKIAVCSFGDGATSEGDFHAGLNFASLYNSKTIFFCQNNQFAISTPRNQQTKAKTLAQKAISYDMPHIQVDGNDVLAILTVMKEAIDLSRNQNTPSFIEAVTYRLEDHSTSDSASLYRDPKEFEQAQAADPLKRIEVFLRKKSVLTDEIKQDIEKKAQTQIEEQILKASREMDPAADDMFTYLLSETYPELEKQRTELLNHINT